MHVFKVIQNPRSFTYDDAAALGRTLVRYWAQRGHQVNTIIVPIVKGDMASGYALRTDMHNGRPR